MALPDLTGQKVNDTYQRLLQIASSGEIVDGTGSLFIPPNAISASFATSASYEIIKELSSSYADTASFADKHNPNNPLFGKGYAYISHGTALTGGSAALYLGTTHSGMDIVRLQDSTLVLGGVTQNYGWRIFGIKHGLNSGIYTTEIDNLIATGSVSISGSLDISLASGSAFTITEHDIDQENRLTFEYDQGDPSLIVASRAGTAKLHLKQDLAGNGVEITNTGIIRNTISGVGYSVVLNSIGFNPGTGNQLDLGYWNRRWKSAYLYTGNKISWGTVSDTDTVALNNPNATNTLQITGSSDVTLDVKGSIVATGPIEVAENGNEFKAGTAFFKNDLDSIAHLHLGLGTSTSAFISTQRNRLTFRGGSTSGNLSSGSAFMTLNRPLFAGGIYADTDNFFTSTEAVTLYASPTTAETDAYFGAYTKQGSGYFATTPHKFIGFNQYGYNDGYAGTSIFHTSGSNSYKGIALDFEGNVEIPSGSLTVQNNFIASGSVNISIPSGSAFTIDESDFSSTHHSRLDFNFSNGDPTLLIQSRADSAKLELSAEQGISGNLRLDNYGGVYKAPINNGAYTGSITFIPGGFQASTVTSGNPDFWPTIGSTTRPFYYWYMSGIGGRFIADTTYAKQQFILNSAATGYQRSDGLYNKLSGMRFIVSGSLVSGADGYLRNPNNVYFQIQDDSTGTGNNSSIPFRIGKSGSLAINLNQSKGFGFNQYYTASAMVHAEAEPNYNLSLFQGNDVSGNNVFEVDRTGNVSAKSLSVDGTTRSLYTTASIVYSGSNITQITQSFNGGTQQITNITYSGSFADGNPDTIVISGSDGINKTYTLTYSGTNITQILVT